MTEGAESRPKRSPLSFRFRGVKRAPSSGFFGMRGKKDEWDSYYNNRYDGIFNWSKFFWDENAPALITDIQEEKRGPLNFRFRGV